MRRLAPAGQIESGLVKWRAPASDRSLREVGIASAPSSEPNMKHFLIKYRLKSGSPEAWRARVEQFIAALEADKELRGRISYRCMKERDGTGYYHLAAAADEQAVRALQGNDLFKRYAQDVKNAAEGDVEVLPLEIIAEAQSRA